MGIDTSIIIPSNGNQMCSHLCFLYAIFAAKSSLFESSLHILYDFYFYMKSNSFQDAIFLTKFKYLGSMIKARYKRID